MRILFVGDVMGRSGREALAKHLPILKEKLEYDVLIVNGENAAHGFGVTEKIANEFFSLGADCITTGNHAWDQREIISYIEREKRFLRPINYPAGTPGQGAYIHTLFDGRKILILHAMGSLYMDPLDNPFMVIPSYLKTYAMGQNVNAIFVDFHAEATSEKMALAQHLDGRVSAVVGTHTHIPTADAQIFEGGTAYQTDAGMTGDYNSVIGMKKDVPIKRFLRKVPRERMVPADQDGSLCGVFVVTDDTTGHAKRIRSIRLGGRLQETEL